jgi:hypothetical protein
MGAYLAVMGTEWAVVATADRLTLDAHNTGGMTFTVSNPGTVTDTVVFDILPGEGSLRSWFIVKEPQRTVNANEAVSYRVTISVPPGTPAGRYDMKAMAYSASAAPEESSRTSGRVSFEVGVVQAAATKRWPILMAASVLVLLVIGVVGFLVWPSDKSGAEPTAGPGATPSTLPSPFVIVETTTPFASPESVVVPSLSAGVTPSAGVTASAGVTTTGSSNQSAPLEFDLRLQGAVPFADRYSVDLSINGTHYVYGFCGFSLETRCSSTAVYSWSLPSVPVGASLTWEYIWVGNSTGVQAQARRVTYSGGAIVKVRCAYLPDSNGRPTCSREL